MPGRVWRVAVDSAIVAITPAPGARRDRIEIRLQAWMDEVPDLDARLWSRLEAGTGLWVLGARPADPSAPPHEVEVVCWGLPLTGTGAASDEQVRRVLRSPSAARELHGSFVVAGWVAGTLRLVTTPDLVATLRHASGPDGHALATRGGLAVLASGGRLRVSLDRVPEFVYLDYVLGEDELLAGVSTVSEAATCAVSPTGVEVSSYWPREDRLAAGTNTGPADLRGDLTAALSGFADRSLRPSVALTAGQDSRLVARTMAAAGIVATAYTMGCGTLDSRGAEAEAGALGWHHRCLPAREGIEESWDRAVAACAWTDGLEIARNTYSPGWRPPEVDPWDVITGSGGEIGRAFYWHDAPPGFEPVPWLMGRLYPRPPERTRELLRRRLRGALDDLRPHARSAGSRLDLLYAFGRMRKWLGHHRPVVPTRSRLSAFTGPLVVRTLLNLEEEDKRAGRTFSLLLGEDPTRTRATGSGVNRRLSHGYWAVRRRLMHRLRRPARRTHVAPLKALTDQVLTADGPVMELFGRDWVDACLDPDAPPVARRRLWNALTVEALQQYLDRGR